MNKVANLMSNAELENAQIGLRKDIIDIRTRIEEYGKTKKHLNELDEEDEKWVRTATYALRMKGHQHNLVLKEIGIRNRMTKENNKKFADYFLEIARECLDSSVFSDIEIKTRESIDKYYAQNPTPGLIKVDY